MWIEIERFEPPRLVGAPGEAATYEYKRDFIGGLLTCVNLDEFLGQDGRAYRIDLWAHDEGLLLDLPQSVIVPGLYPDNSGIRGPVIIDMTNDEGESISLSEDGLARIRFTRPHAPLTVIQFGDEREEIGAFPILPIIRITNGG